MIRYLVIGSGYRSLYFGRIAATYPGLFRAMYLCRSEEKAEMVRTSTGAEATTDVNIAIHFQPDFVVDAVDRAHVADVAMEWAQRGFPVMTETPVGDTREKLDALWKLQQAGAKITCLEQYHRYPILSAGISAVRQGVIGNPVSLYISLAHDYHGASLIRRILGTYGEAYTMRGTATRTSAAATDSRYGAIWDGSSTEEERTELHISFASGKEAIYDFSPLQYRTFIRSRHLTVRGEKGEWSDAQILCAEKDGEIRRIPLVPDIPEAYRCLDTQNLRDMRRVWRSELAMDTMQDEFAVARMLLDMKNWTEGGSSPYPLQEALDDAVFWLAGMEAVAHPWQEIRVPEQPWHREPV